MARGVHQRAPLLTASPDRRAQIARLERELEQLRRQEDEALVVLIAHVVEDRVFSARELFDHRVVDAALRGALAAAGLDSVPRLGKYLRRVHQAAPAGWCLERVGVDELGVCWCLKVCDHVQVDPCPPSATRG